MEPPWEVVVRSGAARRRASLDEAVRPDQAGGISRPAWGAGGGVSDDPLRRLRRAWVDYRTSLPRLTTPLRQPPRPRCTTGTKGEAVGTGMAGRGTVPGTFAEGPGAAQAEEHPADGRMFTTTITSKRIITIWFGVRGPGAMKAFLEEVVGDGAQRQVMVAGAAGGVVAGTIGVGGRRPRPPRRTPTHPTRSQGWGYRWGYLGEGARLCSSSCTYSRPCSSSRRPRIFRRGGRTVRA